MNKSIPAPDQGAGIILDTPEQIQAYRIIATLHGVRLEIRMQEHGFPPTACPTRGRALASARRIAKEFEWTEPVRTRKQALEAMEEIVAGLRSVGALPKEKK